MLQVSAGPVDDEAPAAPVDDEEDNDALEGKPMVDGPTAVP